MRSSVLFVTDRKSLEPEVFRLIHSQKHPILTDLKIGTERTSCWCNFYLKQQQQKTPKQQQKSVCVCGWAGFTK